MNPKKKSKLSLGHLSSPWEGNENSIWLASRLKLIRNIENFKFPGKLDANRRKQILALITKDLLACPSLKQIQVLKADEIDPVEKEYFFERYLAVETFHQAHAGDAFALTGDALFFAIINVRNHLQLLLLDSRNELEKSWNQLIRYESELGKSLKFAFSPEFGFLTADPSQCGTALIASAYLQLPALIHTNAIQDTLRRHPDPSITIRGIQGSPMEFVGDILVASNLYTLGVKEEKTISSLRGYVTHLVLEEKSARSRIRSGEHMDVVKDHVSRAYGLLKHSFKLDPLETLQAISLMKLGLDLEWIRGVTIAQLNALFFTCRRAHLLMSLSEEVPPELIPQKRSALVREQLKPMELAM